MAASQPGSAVDAAAVQSFEQRLRGRLLRPSGDGYDAAGKVWNGMIDRKPALIARCAGAADVMAAVDFARTHDLLVAVRGAGHSASSQGVCDGGLVIDLSDMKGMRVNPAARTARAEPGLTWGEFDRETQAFWKLSFLKDLTDDVIDTVVKHGPAMPSPLSAAIIEFYGGAVNRVGVGDTTYPHRNALYLLNIISIWPDKTQTDANIRWVRGLFDAVQPFSTGRT